MNIEPQKFAKNKKKFFTSILVRLGGFCGSLFCGSAVQNDKPI
jgi:hypothetical protein